MANNHPDHSVLDTRFAQMLAVVMECRPVDTDTASCLLTSQRALHGSAGFVTHMVKHQSKPCATLWAMLEDFRGVSNAISMPNSFGGKFRNVPQFNHVRVTAAPPQCQSQNGLMEGAWAVAHQMARAFLTQSRLPKLFWFWVVREAIARMNVVPMHFDDAESPLHTTSMELHHGKKPDVNVLCNFGSVGFFTRDRDGTHH